MKRGQTGIGLVILGVVAIIAIIGLVLLFTRASSSGAYVSWPGYPTARSGIGQSYAWGTNVGITQGYPVTSGQRWGPDIQTPGPGTRTAEILVGSRLFPAFVVQATTTGSTAGLEDLYGWCIDSLVFHGHIGADLWSPYVQPNWQARPGVVGNYPGSSAAYTREPIAFPRGGRGSLASIGRTGGDVIVWVNTGGLGDGTQSQENVNNQVGDRVLSLMESGALGKDRKTNWRTVTVTNSVGQTKAVAACDVGEWKYPFPQ